MVTILYLDESETGREAVRVALNGRYHLLTPTHPSDIEHALTGAPYELLLSQHNAFAFGDPVLLDIVQARDPLLPVIFIVPLAAELSILETINQGVAGYLLRTPHYLDRLPFEIERLLAQRRLRHQHEAADRDRAHLLQQSQSDQRRLQLLSQRLLEAQETERRLLAHELHDQIGQALTAVKINLQALQRNSGITAPQLEENVAIVERAIQKVRTMSLELRPSLLDDLGLVSALRWYIDRQAQQTGYTAHFVSGNLGQRPAPHLETICFRVAQEALTNVARHAQASQVTVSLHEEDKTLQLTIQDNGIGFDVAAARAAAAHGASLGLPGMEERATLGDGRLTIESGPQGTMVTLTLPLTSKGRRGRQPS
jgi:signal transduction histidine kinase